MPLKSDRRTKALWRNAINPIMFHPFNVVHTGGFVVRTEGVNWGAVFVFEVGFIFFIF